MIYGSLNVHVTQDVTDLIGIRTLVLKRYWQVVGVSRPTQADVDAAKPAAPGGVPGGVMLMGEQTMKERGRYVTLWTYQGINGDGKSVTFKDRRKSLDYGFAKGFSQVPIQMHKDFEELFEKYQGRPNNDGTTVLWSPTLSGGTSGGGLAKAAAKAGTNPMYGIQEYFEMDGVYHFRYAEVALPKNLQSGVGTIVSALPGKPPPLADGRNWLKAPADWQRKGVVYDITEYYWMSRRGGWPKPVYGGSGSGGGDGAPAFGSTQGAGGLY